MSTFDQFDRELASPPPPTLVSDTEAHAKLKRNLSIALDRHKEIMDFELPDIPAGDKRLALEAANMTVKAALATDKTALKARQDNTIARVLLRLLFYRKLRGREMGPDDLKRLQTAPRVELEAALGPRALAEYDQLEW